MNIRRIAYRHMGYSYNVNYVPMYVNKSNFWFVLLLSVIFLCFVITR